MTIPPQLIFVGGASATPYERNTKYISHAQRIGHKSKPKNNHFQPSLSEQHLNYHIHYLHKMVISDRSISWDTLLQIINDNQLDQLYRSNESTNRYRKFKNEVSANNDTVVKYIIRNRLGWVSEDGQIDTTPSSNFLFTEPADVRIIPNDFPYNFEANVTHLVVWTKLSIESDPESEIGDITDDVRAVIDRYVEKNFVENLGLEKDNVTWFRNYPAIQSVSELSHVHILVRDLQQDHYGKIVNTSGLTLKVDEYHQIVSAFRQ